MILFFPMENIWFIHCYVYIQYLCLPYLLPAALLSLLLLLTGFLKDDSVLSCIASHQLLNPHGLTPTPAPPKCSPAGK